MQNNIASSTTSHWREGGREEGGREGQQTIALIDDLHYLNTRDSLTQKTAQKDSAIISTKTMAQTILTMVAVRLPVFQNCFTCLMGLTRKSVLGEGRKTGRGKGKATVQRWSVGRYRERRREGGTRRTEGGTEEREGGREGREGERDGGRRGREGERPLQLLPPPPLRVLVIPFPL